jgi:acetyl-CoA acyltransferase 2
MSEFYSLDVAGSYELRRRNAQFAVVSLCIGGRHEIAMVIENV